MIKLVKQRCLLTIQPREVHQASSWLPLQVHVCWMWKRGTCCEGLLKQKGLSSMSREVSNQGKQEPISGRMVRTKQDQQCHICWQQATTIPKCRGTEWWSMDKDNMWLPQSVQNLLSNKHQRISKTTYSPSELTLCWICDCRSLGGALAIHWLSEGWLSEVMGWVMVTTEDRERALVP